VRDDDNLEVDVLFPKMIQRLGLFARVVVRGLVSMHTDWTKHNRHDVLMRFSQYEQALGGYGGSPLVPQLPTQGANGESFGSGLLNRLRDMARLCDCLRGLDVVSTAACVIHGRPAIMVAKKNHTTPWYGLTLLLYTDTTTNRVSALKSGRAMTINGIRDRTKAEAEKYAKMFAPEVIVGNEPTVDSKANHHAASPKHKMGVEDVMDIVTLDDFLS